MNSSNMDMHQQQIQFEFPTDAGEFYLNCFASANRGGFSVAPFNRQLLACCLFGCLLVLVAVVADVAVAAAVIRCCCGAVQCSAPLPGRLTIIIYWPHASHSFDFVFSPGFFFGFLAARVGRSLCNLFSSPSLGLVGSYCTTVGALVAETLI